MNFFKPILFLFIFSTLFSDYGGGYPGAILRTATNAREVSLSNSLVSAYNTGFNAFTNPSLISHGKNIEISSSLFSLPSNINMQIFSISRNLPPNAGAGISIVRLGTNDLIGLNSNEEYTGSLSHSDSYVMMSFGLHFSDYLSLGVNGKALFQDSSTSNAEDISTKGTSVDLGLFSSPVENINLGLKIDNIFGKYNLDESSDIPRRIIFGLSYFLNDNIKTFFQHELIDIYDKYLTHRTSFGLEYKLNYNFPIHLRSGFKQNRWAIINNNVKNNLYVFSSGFGVEFKVADKTNMNLDYGIIFNSIGISNVISLCVEL